MTKWQCINVFIKNAPTNASVENASINIFQNAFTPVNPSYSPPPQHLQSVPVVDEVPCLVIPITPIIPSSRSRLEIATTNHSVPCPNTDNALTGNLSANARARLIYKPSPFYRCVMALSPPHYGRGKLTPPFYVWVMFCNCTRLILRGERVSKTLWPSFKVATQSESVLSFKLQVSSSLAQQLRRCVIAMLLSTLLRYGWHLLLFVFYF